MSALHVPAEKIRLRDDSPSTAESSDQKALLLWSAAALMETLVLVGGLMWIMHGPGAIGMTTRVALVALAAVVGGGGFVIAAARKSP